MNLLLAEKLALNLMKQYNLTQIGWSFSFDRAKRRFGCCMHNKRLITLSRNLVEINDEESVKDTILHEIAHALVGKGHGHDNVWKMKALEIGCNGKRCYSSEDTNIVKGKYQAVCPKCNHLHSRHKKPKNRVSCGKCSNKFDERYILQYNITN